MVKIIERTAEEKREISRLEHLASIAKHKGEYGTVPPIVKIDNGKIQLDYRFQRGGCGACDPGCKGCSSKTIVYSLVIDPRERLIRVPLKDLLEPAKLIAFGLESEERAEYSVKKDYD